MMNERLEIACELLRIAAKLSPEEELAVIDGMSISQLIDEIRRNKSNYTSIPNSMKVKKFDDRIDMSKPMRNMTVKEMLRNVAKMGVNVKQEEQDGQKEH